MKPLHVSGRIVRLLRQSPLISSATLVGAFTFLGFSLRIYLLGEQNVWWDEALAIWAVRKGFLPMTLWTAGDVHPPLFFWGLYAMTRLAGESEFAGRFPSLIYGVLTIPLVYQLGRSLFDRQIGWLSALIVAMARFHIWWSQEMRMYILAGLLGTASLYALVRWWQREERGDRKAWRTLLPYVLTSAGALYTLYLSALILLVENAFVFLAGLGRPPADRWRLWRRWALAQIAILVIFLPWLLLALPRMQSWSTAGAFRFSLFLQLYLTALSLGISTYIERYFWAALPFLGLALIGLIFAPGPCQAEHKGPQLSRLLLFLCLGLPPLFVYLLTRPRGLFYAPQVEARYLLPFAPPFYILIACGLRTLWQRARPLAWVGAAFVAVAFVWTLPQHYVGRYLRDELQSMARTILAYAEPGDAVWVISGSRFPMFDYAYHHPLLLAAREEAPPPVYYLPEGAELFTAQNVASQLEPLAAKHERIWLAQVNYQMQDPEGLAKRWLDERYRSVLSHGYAHNALYLYDKEGQPPRVSPGYRPKCALAWSPGCTAVLDGYDLPTQEFRPGDTIRLALYWTNPREAQVTVEMQDAEGRILAQQSATLWEQPWERARLLFEFPIYGRTPPGRYRFRISALDASLTFGEVRVTGTPPLPRVAYIENPLSLTLGHQIRLEGYALRVIGRRRPVISLRPGDRVELTLYWRAPQKVSQRYTVFTHLVGTAFNPATNGPVWGQHDSEPLEGGLPTTQWFPGELVADRHVLPLDASAPPGEYELEVGLYDLYTGARLQVWDGEALLGDRVLLGRWPVR